MMKGKTKRELSGINLLSSKNIGKKKLKIIIKAKVKAIPNNNSQYLVLSMPIAFLYFLIKITTPAKTQNKVTTVCITIPKLGIGCSISPKINFTPENTIGVRDKRAAETTKGINPYFIDGDNFFFCSGNTYDRRKKKKENKTAENITKRTTHKNKYSDCN